MTKQTLLFSLLLLQICNTFAQQQRVTVYIASPEIRCAVKSHCSYLKNNDFKKRCIYQIEELIQNNYKDIKTTNLSDNFLLSSSREINRLTGSPHEIKSNRKAHINLSPYIEVVDGNYKVKIVIIDKVSGSNMKDVVITTRGSITYSELIQEGKIKDVVANSSSLLYELNVCQQTILRRLRHPNYEPTPLEDLKQVETFLETTPQNKSQSNNSSNTSKYTTPVPLYYPQQLMSKKELNSYKDYILIEDKGETAIVQIKKNNQDVLTALVDFIGDFQDNCYYTYQATVSIPRIDLEPIIQKFYSKGGAYLAFEIDKLLRYLDAKGYIGNVQTCLDEQKKPRTDGPPIQNLDCWKDNLYEGSDMAKSATGQLRFVDEYIDFKEKGEKEWAYLEYVNGSPKLVERDSHYWKGNVVKELNRRKNALCDVLLDTLEYYFGLKAPDRNLSFEEKLKWIKYNKNKGNIPSIADQLYQDYFQPKPLKNEN